ncbi:coatomer subunit delta-like protein, partial [Tanacetum coccineum]
VIEDMEKLKQKLHEHIHEARHHLKLPRELHRNLVAYDSPLQPKLASFSSQSTPKEIDTSMVILRLNSTHPNINKDLFSNENILGSKDPNRSFPNGESGDGLGLLKWRMQSKDASALPLTSKFLYVSVSTLDDGLILLEVARWADRSGCITVKNIGRVA